MASRMASAQEKPQLIVKKLDLPVIGLGTWQTFDVDDPATVEPVLAAFIQEGGKVVDSSPMYGRSESVVGDLAKKLSAHDKLFLATKVWTQGKQNGVKQMRESMDKLRTMRVDLMQVHNLVDVEAHLDTLRQWKAENKVRYVGVTHYTASAHDEVARVITKHPVDFVQINYSIGERDAEKRLLAIAHERNIAVIANRPFAGGELFSTIRQRPLPSFAAEIDCDSWAQLMLKWIVSHPAITVAIPATSKVKHLHDNMRAARGKLPDEKMRERIVEAALR